MYYIGSIPFDDNYIEHFGIFGMKWGIRRWQNKDGTLTEAGKKHYYKHSGEWKRAGKKQARRDAAKLGALADSHAVGKQSKIDDMANEIANRYSSIKIDTIHFENDDGKFKQVKITINNEADTDYTEAISYLGKVRKDSFISSFSELDDATYSKYSAPSDPSSSKALVSKNESISERLPRTINRKKFLRAYNDELIKQWNRMSKDQKDEYSDISKANNPYAKTPFDVFVSISEEQDDIFKDVAKRFGVAV